MSNGTVNIEPRDRSLWAILGILLTIEGKKENRDIDGFLVCQLHIWCLFYSKKLFRWNWNEERVEKRHDSVMRKSFKSFIGFSFLFLHFCRLFPHSFSCCIFPPLYSAMIVVVVVEATADSIKLVWCTKEKWMVARTMDCWRKFVIVEWWRDKNGHTQNSKVGCDHFFIIRTPPKKRRDFVDIFASKIDFFLCLSLSSMRKKETQNLNRSSASRWKTHLQEKGRYRTLVKCQLNRLIIANS